jgi:acyl-CoA thioester hydrolase
VRSIGIDQARLKKEGMFFAVRKVDADFLRPAVYDDVLTVETVVESQTGARLNLIQRVLREGEEIFTAKVMIVSLSVDGYPVALPADIRQLLTEN